MDRKGLIGLLVCGLLFAAHLYYSGIEAKKKQDELIKQRKAEETAQAEAPVSDGEGNPAELAELDQAQPVEEQTVTLETDKVIFTFTSAGGGVKTAEFKEQLAVGSEKEHVKLNRYETSAVGELVSGSVDAPLGVNYEIADQTEDKVVFGARTADGLAIVKTWTLSKEGREVDDYLLKLEVTLQNTQQEGTIDLGTYGIHAGAAAPIHSGEANRFTGFYYYTGGLKFKSGGKTYFKEHEDITYAGVSNQFFATMLGMDEPVNSAIRSRSRTVTMEETGGGEEKPSVRMAWGLPREALRPNEHKTLKYDVFMGPKDNKVVRQLGKGRGDLMAYGFFSPISRFLNWLLNLYHDSIFAKFADKWAWGLAIILLTLTIRGLMWPLHNASAKTMKRMSKLQPLMQEIKEKHPDDPQKQQMEMAKLYKQYEINPVGGCLPMFAQIPIFFGFFSMLQHAVEFRGQSFLWVPDLSLPDTIFDIPLPFSIPFLGDHLPINLLPILMVVTMFIQMQISPKAGDPMQRRIFMLMPFMFFFFCYNYASALALYWTTQNIFSIGQTWLMQRQPEVELQKKKPGKKSFFEKMQEKAEEAQRIQEQRRKGGGGPSSPQTKKPKKPRGPRTGG
ncbi:MAG: membrane protein insertase YidC [Verrucomicrobiota bacterium JB023]|nr:membrane protein insertase YidC [Verrucomicrobiota bacterium JB023]